ncbi:MAG TPA: glycoside hydrolase family 15 protein [Thermoanaerobaculia bacterium]|nr:glycoside hydrolase family 15 protein [Thermoanaerobaculia bacterium]
MSDLDLAVIGNCGFSALVDARARISWACLPHFDGDPFFCSLLAGDRDQADSGFFEILIEHCVRTEQAYVENTAIVVTRLYDESGGIVEVTDFAPRFPHFGRSFHPTAIVRQVRPLRGMPRVEIRIRPAYAYGAHRPDTTRGSNHIRFVAPGLTMRLTTDAPISYVLGEVPFLLEDPLTLYLGPDEPLEGAVGDVGREFYERTKEYWIEFSRHLAIPFEWQEAVIRAAITLKLSSFEETGAIVAAMTSSIPEAPASGRNWDYRYCWLRDAYFVVRAANRLGVTDTMERYLQYITNVSSLSADGYLQPVYGIRLERRLEERDVASLRGYRGMGPVRVGNDAFTQVQNDSYGSVIHAVAQAFFDSRLTRRGTIETFRRLEHLGEQAAHRYREPDAGVWEFRSRRSVHTFSAVMCWVACDRLARIAVQLGLAERAGYWAGHAERIRGFIEENAWSDRLKRFRSTLDGDDAHDPADASLFLLSELGFLRADDPRFAATVAELERALRTDELVLRYRTDEIGDAATAFAVCTFWYIDALHALGRTEEARELFERMLALRNRHGLLSEDLEVRSGELWGNFPQTYSMVGLINSAILLSRPWEEAF